MTDTNQSTDAKRELGVGDPSAERLETAIAGHKMFSVEEGSDEMETRDTGAVVHDTGGDPEPPEDSTDSDQPAADEEPEDEKPQDGAPEALPDYDPENPEVVRQYEERYYKDSTLNLKGLSDEFWANYNSAEDKGSAGLNEGTYEFLNALGLSKDYVKEVEKGQLALREAEQRATDEAFYSKVDGGKQGFDAAFRWAQTPGGYSKEQKERFNAAFQKGGEDLEEAVEVLMSRFRKSGGKVQGGEQQRGPKFRRRSSPQRSTSSAAHSGGGQGGDVFQSRAEYQSAWNQVVSAESEARKSGDASAIRKAVADREAVRKKVRRSPNWQK